MTRHRDRMLLLQAVVIFSIILTLLAVPPPVNRLHISLPESQLLRYGDDNVYVRVYQTVFAAADGISETELPNKIPRKDIWQDADGRVIIAPGNSLEKPTWVGIGDPRNQLKFVANYKTQVDPADNPLIRSFLVDYETIRKVLNPRRIATEKNLKHNRLGFSINVDQHSANQFGLNRLDAYELRKHALPKSLVTYTSKAVDQTDLGHWGTIRLVSELYDKLGLPSEDIPGAYSDTHVKERNAGSTRQIDNYLQDLYKIYRSQDGFNVESDVFIQTKLKEFNDRYVFEKISMNDFPFNDKDLKLEESKLKRKLTKQVQKYESELKEMYENKNPDTADIEKKVNEYNEKFRSTLEVWDLPNVKKDVISLQTKLIGDIKELNVIHRIHDKLRNEEFEAKLSKYNDFMIAESRQLKTTDLENIKAYMKEAQTRRHIRQMFYVDHLNPHLKRIVDLQWQMIPDLTTDHMYITGIYIDMHELLARSYRFQTQFDHANRFEACLEAYSNKLNSFSLESSSADFSRIRKFKSPSALMKKAFPKDPNLLRKIQYGFFVDIGDLTDEHILARLNDISTSVAGEIPDKLKRVSIAGQLESFSDNIVREGRQVTYSSEMIVQLDRSVEVEKASEYLYNRYCSEGKKVKHVVYKSEDGFYHTVSGKQLHIELDVVTRISVVGRGELSNGQLFIGGKSADTLALDISQVLLPKDVDDKISIGKFSLIAGNVATNEDIEFGSRFGKNFADALDKQNIQSVIALRIGELQVSKEGYKLYGKYTECHYRSKTPILVKKSFKHDKLVTEYGMIDSNSKRVIWSTKVPEHAKDIKLLILSESYGSVDIAAVVETTRLKSIAVVNENIKLSGLLNFQDEDIIIRTSQDEFQQPREGTHLDMDIEREAQHHLADETGIQSVLTQVDAAEWVDRLLRATNEASQALPGDWVPLIDTAEVNDEGFTRVTVVNLDTSKTQTITMENDAFVRFKKISKRNAMYVNNLPKLTRATVGMYGTGGILGLGGFIMSAIQISKAKQCKENVTCPVSENAKKLAKSLEINAYVGFAMGAFGLVSDSTQIAELAVSFKLSKKAVNGIATMTKSTAKFLKFSKVFGAVGMGVGSVGSVVGLGFSAYQLAHAETKAQKIEFGIQVGVDSVSVIASGVAVGAAITAAVASGSTAAVASSIAAAAGPIGIGVAVVGILTSVITSLAFEFKHTRNNARLVGEYFDGLDNVYRKYGFEYDRFRKTFTILEHAIVKAVDLENGIIELDSQYIYRTRHGKTGNGKINYFFWFNDFPEMIHDKYQAINIRNGIGYGGNRNFDSERDADVLVLPAIPKSYISYSYSRLPFCTAMHDKGFDVIRRLEQDYRFDYDFYIFPGEQIVSSINHEYVNTFVTVKLASSTKTIAVPDISDKKYIFLQNKYTFKLITKGPKHTVLLHDYFTFHLDSTSSSSCTWYLKHDNVDLDDVTIDSHDQITVGRVTVHVSSYLDKLYVLDDNGGLLLLDLRTKTKSLASIIQNADTTSSDLKAYLSSMTGDWLKAQRFVVIANFTHSGEYIGRAYYDTTTENFLYTNLRGVPVSKQFKDSMALLGVFQNDMYFISKEDNTTVIWRTNIKSNQVMASYVLYCGNSEFSISKLSTQGASAYLIQKVYKVSLIYIVHANEIKLAFIDGNTEDIFKLADTCFPTLHDFLPRTKMLTSRLEFPGKCLHATTIPILPLKQTSKTGVSRHYWLYMNESQTPSAANTDIFCTSNNVPIATGIITPHIENECDDLSLRDIQVSQTGQEIYFFYCEGDKNSFHYQVGDNESMKVYVPGEIERIEDFGNVKLIKSTNGGLYKFTETQNFTLAALSFKSIAFGTSRRKQTNSPNWKLSFKNVAEQALTESFIPILGMKDIYGTDLTAWYDQVEDRLIIVSPLVNATDIVYIGPTPSSFLVWLYNPHQRQVILQKILDDQTVSSMIVRTNNEAYLNNVDMLSVRIAARDVNSIEYMQGSVLVVTKEGTMLSIDYLNAVTLLGVNATWIRNNNNSLSFELESLCNLYQSQSLITLGKRPKVGKSTAHMWYHCGLKGQLSLVAQTNMQPSYLGMAQAEQLVFLFFGEAIVQFNLSEHSDVYSESSETAVVKDAMVRGKSFLVQTLDYRSLNIVPKLDNVSSLVVGTAYNSMVVIEATDWLHYKNIIITAVGTSGPQLMDVKINPPYHCSYQFDEVENDTVIKDPISNRVVVLEGFTVQFDKNSENYMPVGNEAVLRVEICGRTPVTFVSNRDRLDALMLKRETVGSKYDAFETKLMAVMILSALAGLLIFGIVFFKCRKRNSRNTSHIAERHSAINRSDSGIVDTSMELGTLTLGTILINECSVS